MNYLSEDEKYKENIDNEEISRIKDFELREIRQKYWSLSHKAFLDEINIPDYKLGDILDKIKKQELEELEKYKLKKLIKTTF